MGKPASWAVTRWKKSNASSRDPWLRNLVRLQPTDPAAQRRGLYTIKKIEAMAGTLGTGTLSAAIPWKDQVLAVGELGVAHIHLN